MKQKMKKVVAAVLAAVMVLAMSVTAFAGGTEDLKGKITITSRGTQSVNGRTFKAYKLFDAKTNGKKVGEDGFKITYTSANDYLTADIVTAIGLVDTEDKTVKASNFETITTWFETATAEELREFVRTVDKTHFGTPSEATGSNEDSVEITGLAYGYYIVVENDLNDEPEKPENLAKSQSALVTVGDADSATINLKATVPTVEKKVKNADGQYRDDVDQYIGHQVEYKVVANLPESGDLKVADVLAGYDTYYFAVKDTLGDGLKFDEKTTVKVVWLDESDHVILDPNSETDPKEPLAVNTTKETADGQDLVVEIDDLKKATVPENAKKLQVVYTATLTNTAYKLAGNDNKVYVEYSNDPSGTKHGKTKDDVVKVYTYKLDIKKVNTNDEPLPGAEFKLTTKDGTVIKFLNPSNDTNYTVCADNTKNASEKLVSGEGGMINIKGLKAGEYVLSETTPPSGYNELGYDIKFKISDDQLGMEETSSVEKLSVFDNDKKEYVESAGTEIKVVNKAGKTLPSTGGVGTTILYVVGILAMAAAVFYFVMNKRSKEVK